MLNFMTCVVGGPRGPGVTLGMGGTGTEGRGPMKKDVSGACRRIGVGTSGAREVSADLRRHLSPSSLSAALDLQGLRKLDQMGLKRGPRGHAADVWNLVATRAF